MSRLKLATMTTYLAFIKVVHLRGDVWALVSPVPWTTEQEHGWNHWALLDLEQENIIRIVDWWGLWDLPEECSTHKLKRTIRLPRGKAMFPRSNCLAGAIAG